MAHFYTAGTPEEAFFGSALTQGMPVGFPVPQQHWFGDLTSFHRILESLHEKQDLMRQELQSLKAASSTQQQMRKASAARPGKNKRTEMRKRLGVPVQKLWSDSESAFEPDVQMQLGSAVRAPLSASELQHVTTKLESVASQRQDNEEGVENMARFDHERDVAKGDVARCEARGLRAERDEAMGEVRRVRQEVEKLEAERDELKKSIDSANLAKATVLEELNRVHEAASRISTEADCARHEAEQLRAEKCKATEELDHACRESAEHRAERDKLQKEVDAARLAEALALDEVHCLRQERVVADRASAEADARYREAKRLQAERDDAMEKALQAQAAHNVAIEEIDRVNRVLAELRAQRDELKERADAASAAEATALEELHRGLQEKEVADSACAAATAAEGEVRRQVQALREACLCPIAADLMQNPVIASDGHTYEFESIARWFEEHDTSPMTGVRLGDRRLRRNYFATSVTNVLNRHPPAPPLGALIEAANLYNREECLNLLARGVPDINAELREGHGRAGATVLHIAASLGWIDVCRRVLAYPDFKKLHKQTVSGRTARGYANEEEIKALLHAAGLHR